MNIKAFAYNGQTITQRQDGYINLTQMCLANGKRIDHWKELKATKSYIAELSSHYPESPVLDTVNGGNTESIGTWGHPLLAQELQRWLDKNNRQTKVQTGCIYIYVDNGNNAYKIGFTTNFNLISKEVPR